VLGSTQVAGRAEEYFPEVAPNGHVYVSTDAALEDPSAWSFDWKHQSFAESLGRVFESGTTPNGVFASKLKWLNMPYLREALPGGQAIPLCERMDSTFPDLRYVWVTRRDKLRQAISLVRARQSGRWIARSAPARQANTAKFNFHLVDSALRRIVEEEVAWERYFAQAGVVPFTVVYEDLVRECEPTVRRLLDHLRIALPSGFTFPAPRLQRQADATSEEWVERYHQRIRARRLWVSAASLPQLMSSRPLRERYVAPRLRRVVDGELAGPRIARRTSRAD
jgi:LPS sulfotransferase NodH